jgi:hypothetical protein
MFTASFWARINFTRIAWRIKWIEWAASISSRINFARVAWWIFGVLFAAF